MQKSYISPSNSKIIKEFLKERILELNNNPSIFIPSEGFKQFLYEKYLEWRNTKKFVLY